MPKVSITVEVAPFTVASNKGEAYSFTIDPKAWTPEYMAYLAEYACGVIVQRSTAAHSDTQGGTAEQRTTDREKAVEKILGAVSGRVGGGLSREEQAMRDALEAQGNFKFLRIKTGEKTKEGNERTKAEPVAEALERFTLAFLEKAGKPADDKNKAAVLARLKKTSAYQAAMGEISDEITL
jgi:hypothetical protein